MVSTKIVEQYITLHQEAVQMYEDGLITMTEFFSRLQDGMITCIATRQNEIEKQITAQEHELAELAELTKLTTK